MVFLVKMTKTIHSLGNLRVQSDYRILAGFVDVFKQQLGCNLLECLD